MSAVKTMAARLFAAAPQQFKDFEHELEAEYAHTLRTMSHALPDQVQVVQGRAQQQESLLQILKDCQLKR